MGKARLNPRQKKFVEYYLANGNATQAAVAAGYSPGNAASQGSKLLRDPAVQAYRRELEQKLFDQMGISRAWIGRRLVEIVDRCMQAEPHMSWDSSQHQYVPDGEWAFNTNGALKALAELYRELDFTGGESPDGGDSPETIEDWLAKQGGSGL